MSLRDEINRVAKTSSEYEKEQEQKVKKAEQETNERIGGPFIHKLEVLLKNAASQGKINKGILSGTLTFDKNLPSTYKTCGAYLPPNIEKIRVHRGLGIFVNKEVTKVTVTPTKEILIAYEVLKKYACKENITLSDLYIIDSDGYTYNKRKITIIDESRYGKDFVYAVDYSMMI